MKIKTSAPSLTPKNLSMSHYTTLGFGQIIPVASYEVCPKSNLTIKPSVFARTDPQKLPNLGSIRLNMHAFYSPFHLVWRHFENFVVGRKSWTRQGAQIYRNCPYTTNVYLSRLFTSDTTLAKTTSVDKSDFGFHYTGDDTKSKYYYFTKKGKSVYHILSALGYKFTFYPPSDFDAGYVSDISVEKYSLLPLMCYFKVFMDRFIPSYLQISCPINSFIEYVNDLSSTQLAQPIENSRFGDLFDYVYTYYEGNYFTSAWTTPNSPLNGVIADFGTPYVNDVALQRTDKTVTVNVTDARKTPQAISDDTSTSIIQGTGYNVQLTNMQLTLLQKFSNLVRRLGYSGSKVQEALKSLFGVHAPALEVNMSEFLGSCSTELQKTDVTSTGSDTDTLGAMAGKSWFADGGEQNFKVNCDYYGMVFVMACLDTPSTFVRGLRRNLTHIEPLSFYQPDFDGTLLQAIRGSELFSQNFYLNNNIVDDLAARALTFENAYGFVPRYIEYSHAIDNISGDFDIGTLSASINPYILPREVVDLDDLRAAFAGGNDDDATFEGSMFGLGVSGQPITPIDVINANDSVQYNRIFKDTSGMADPFFCVFHFNTLANTPCLPLDDVAEIKGRGKELEFSQNGHYLT